MIIVGRENHVSGHFHLLICVPSLDWQLLQVEVYSGKNIFTRCSHQRPFSRYRQLAAYIYCARADYRLIAYFLTFSKLKWVAKEREVRFTKSQKHLIVNRHELLQSFHKPWCYPCTRHGHWCLCRLVPWQAFNSWTVNRVTKNMKISTSVVCTFEMPLVLDRVTALNWWSWLHQW